MSKEKSFSKVINLKSPIIRGETKIEAIQIREPDAGSLRGISLFLLGQLNTDEVLKIAPRLALPAITEDEAAELSGRDIFKIGSEIVAFLFDQDPVETEASQTKSKP